MADGRTARTLTGAPWLASGPLPRLLGVLDHGGEEARIVGAVLRNFASKIRKEDPDGAQ